MESPQCPEEELVWVTWLQNRRSKFNGQTEQIPTSRIVNPPEKLEPNTWVKVYWPYQSRKYWVGVVTTGKRKKLTPHGIGELQKTLPPPPELVISSLSQLSLSSNFSNCRSASWPSAIPENHPAQPLNFFLQTLLQLHLK